MSNDPGLPRPKRVAPPRVPPVSVEGLKITAVHWGRSRGFGQNGGYIAASDPGTGEELWTLKVYDIAYDPSLEEDVQDIFIEKMKAENGAVLVTDEKGRRYRVDVRARTVAPQ